MSKDQDDRWPIEVFRYSYEKGWELFQQASSVEKMTAAPRRGCVEVKELRLRIHILQQRGTNDSGTGTNVDHFESGKVEKRNSPRHTTNVVRRRDTLLLSKGDFGAVVFKFQSVAACVAFTDRLVELNQSFALNPNEDKATQRLQSECSENGKSLEQCDDVYGGNSDNLSNDDRNFAIRAHMIALLHDKDFLGFVDRIENCLSSSNDCTKMLEALEYPHGKKHRVN